MRHQLDASRSPWSVLLSYSSQLLIGTIALSTATLGLAPAIAYSAEPAAPAPSTVPAKPATLPDGVYLYGQAPEPDQIGQGYFVFEVNHGKVLGALYMPRSSFDCASGSFQEDQLALTVVNSYDRTTNPFEIALQKDYSVATDGNPVLQKVGLQGFHRLNTISENDYRILNTCKADAQNQNQQKQARK